MLQSRCALCDITFIHPIVPGLLQYLHPTTVSLTILYTRVTRLPCWCVYKKGFFLKYLHLPGGQNVSRSAYIQVILSSTWQQQSVPTCRHMRLYSSRSALTGACAKKRDNTVPIYSSFSPSVHPSTCSSINPSLSIHSSIHLSICSSINPSVYLPIHPPIHPSHSLIIFIHPPTY